MFLSSCLEIHIPAFRFYRPDVESAMWINTEDNSLELENFDAFTQRADVAASVSLLDLPEPKPVDLDYSQLAEEMMKLPEEEQQAYITAQLNKDYPPESLFTSRAETINRMGATISLDLSDYLIDFVEQEGECYVPLQTLNDLFLPNLYL